MLTAFLKLKTMYSTIVFILRTICFFFYKIVCCINFTTFLYSFKYYFVNFVVSSLTWRDLMFDINAFIFSSFQYFFIMRILFSNFFCLCCAFNVMMIKFYHFDLCRIMIENYKSCWICYINSAAKFFNIFCCLNIKFFTIFNFRNLIVSFFVFRHHFTMMTMFLNFLSFNATSLFIIINFGAVRDKIKW